jgi:hypothetical protein
VKNRDPSKTQEQLAAGRELRLGGHPTRGDIDIRLVKPVEQHDPIGTRFIKRPHEIADRGEEIGDSLTAIGIFTRRLTSRTTPTSSDST